MIAHDLMQTDWRDLIISLSPVILILIGLVFKLIEKFTK